MDLVIPEILSEARGLSISLLVAGFTVGFLLWLLGWWSYRFWVALSLTLVAGVVGMYEAEFFRMEPLLAALLLAIAVGVLCLSIMRIISFALGGIACISLIGAVAPSVDAPSVCFLAGGIIATLIFRLWTMALTSFAGSLLMCHCAMSMLDRVVKTDFVKWSRDHWVLLNWVCVGVALAGCLIQYVAYRFLSRNSSDSEDDDDESSSKGIIGRLRIPMPFRKAA